MCDTALLAGSTGTHMRSRWYAVGGCGGDGSAWVVGESAATAHTTDAGVTWQSSSRHPDLADHTLYDVACVADGTAVAVRWASIRLHHPAL